MNSNRRDFLKWGAALPLIGVTVAKAAGDTTAKLEPAINTAADPTPPLRPFGNTHRLMLKNVRLEYPHLIEPHRFTSDSRPRYMAWFARTLEAETNGSWAEMRELHLILRAGLDEPLQLACLKDYGNAVQATSTLRPLVVDRSRKVLLENPRYGSRVNAVLDFWVMRNPPAFIDGPCVVASLRGVQTL